MTDIKFKPVRHNHMAFVEKAAKRRGFVVAYEALVLKYHSISQKLKARSLNSLTQDDQMASRHD